MSARRIVGVAVVSYLALLPALVSAQTGSIAGAVKDTTGAVLPGVTVEAASPALIEKVRTVVTDGQGQYKIVDLRPGTYTVTFTLSGFNTVKREGLELTTGFTAPANAEMRVGALEETITVSGASPIVDVQNARSQNVLTREVLDTLPSSKTFQSFAAVTVGASGGGARDVGGNKGEGFTPIALHGNRFGLSLYDGMRATALTNNRRGHVNQLAAQEVVMETSGGGSAESQSGGLNVNVVPKDGGNTFSTAVSAAYTNKHLQSSNLTDALRARGLTRSNSTAYIYDAGVGVGGPIKQDTLWFYTAFRKWSHKDEYAGLFFNKTPHTLFYEPDLSRPAYTAVRNRDFSVRLTWQATQKHKITLWEDSQAICQCYYNLVQSIRSPEATVHLNWATPNNYAQVVWTYPATNRLLFEAALGHRIDYQENPRTEGVTADDRPVLELSTNLRYGSAFETPGVSSYGKHGNGGIHPRASLTYVTGSHAFKTGFYLLAGHVFNNPEANFPVRYDFRNQVPVQLSYAVYPGYDIIRLNDLGIYAQDQWTLGRMTLNVGVRFDYFNGYAPAQVRPGGQFVPEFRFDAVHNIPNYKDISPRLGVAYDLFGNGKTALKGTLGLYQTVQGGSIPTFNNPARTIVETTTRTWNDANGDYVPDCDLKSPLANGECGRMANQNFGKLMIGTRSAEDVLIGWGRRPASWQGSAIIQHELRPNIGLAVGYFRTSFRNFSVTDNLALSPEDYDPYCVTAPKDARLPRGGGYQLCGLYNLKREKFGIPADNLVTQASNFGRQTEIYNGVDVSLSARFGRGGLFTGGVGTGRTVTDDCAVVVDSPEKQFCRATNPWAGQTQIKLNGSYPLPWDLRVSATYQNLPGIAYSASYVATNAEIAPSLGRNLAACGAAATCNATTIIELVGPFTLREARDTQLDLRLSKIVRLGRGRLQGHFDVYNVFNSASVLSETTRYGPSWLLPTDVLGARLVKFGVDLEF
jgi:hypothetical protein